MASSEKDTAPNEPSTEANDESPTNGEALTDGEGLNAEQEAALNKIMAEIEGQEDAEPENESAAAHPTQDQDTKTEAEKHPSQISDDAATNDEELVDSETQADSEGLDSEQEDALNKIMAEIEGQSDAASEKDAVADLQPADQETEPVVEEDPLEASDDANGNEEADTASEGLDPDQEDALNKIMAEIEGQSDAASEKNTVADLQPADQEAEPVVEEDPVEASDDTNGNEEADTASEGLDPDQEDALNKIMAEIQGSSDGDVKAGDSDGEPSQPASSEETTGVEDPIENMDTGGEAVVAEGLSADQEDALNKIMAEIDAKDEDPPEPEEEGLSAEQAAALENIMAEIEGGGEDDAPAGDGADSDPAAAEAPEVNAAEAQAESLEKAAAPSNDSSALKDEKTPEAETEASPEDTTADKPPSTDDLMSQIQAAAQGPDDELNVSAPSPDEVKAPASPTTVTEDIDNNEASAQGTMPLAEVKAEPSSSKPSPRKPSTTPKKRSPKKKPTSKKIVRILTCSGAAAAAVLLAASATYFWLSHDNAPHTAVAPQAPVGAPVEIVSEDTSLNLSSEEDLLTETSTATSPENAPLEISPESERLAELSSRIRTQRDDMLAKAREIDELSAYYEEGIEKITGELVGHINTKQVSSLKAARKDTAILMGLETIQRRAGYVAKLYQPRFQIQAATEELLYLERKAGVLSMIAEKSSGTNLDPFAKQVDEALKRLSRNVAELSLEAEAASDPSIEDVWKTVWAAHVKAPKKEPPATVAMRRNRMIEAEICKGDFNRVAELSTLSSDAAACLAAWKGKDLFLNNLERLSPEAARSLSQWEGDWLILNGLKILTPDAASQLANWNGKRLSLNGLEELTSATTKALAKWQGHQLELIGLRRLAAWDNPQVTLYVRSEVRDNLAR